MEDNRILDSMFPSDILPKVYPKEPTPEEKAEIDDVLNSNIFNVMLNRRSQRKFEEREIEGWKIDIIFAAADTAPTAGGFQGFEIYHIIRSELKQNLIKAANNQPYVNAPLVLVFCSNPSRIKLNFHQEILNKFSVQDATLAAGYAQLASHALGLSSIWIGMFNEHLLKEVINTDLEPSSILCIGYPKKMLIPKPKRNLTDLIHTV
ncbi:nitroreductase family protein [Candidatus Nitrosocosmicus arcticus]|uniref:Nitroreductase-like protein n=1 Tax=Candidatus Nitrosocosmicus arcticus TaxID=2035267 RepID=A0A557SYI0_9ARCH|nr:nitroreductase family protein [Candidatus Nitrosocosmicus arcticus]TVP41667.1 nitroreductase-like protein [Candidatus Nitrosocosmicus arcticus]